MTRSVTAALLGVALLGAIVLAEPPGPPPGRGPGGMMGRGMTSQQRMAACQSLMSDMQAQDAKLAELGTKMNAATGEAKTDAIAAVVNELVQQREDMHRRMTGMMQGMAGCPMMQGQAGTPGATSGAGAAGTTSGTGGAGQP